LISLLRHNLARKYRDDARLNQIKTDLHSPPQYGVLDTLSTMPAFYGAFDFSQATLFGDRDSLTAQIW